MFLGDYHTHTVYSCHGKKLHAKGTVLQNALAAARAGLKELAVTDHGIGHYYGITQRAEDFADIYAAFVEECKQAESATGVRIYPGLENNLDPRAGKRKDIPPLLNYGGAIQDELCIIQGGYHAFIGAPSYVRNMLFWTRNVVFKLPPRSKLIEHNTEAYKRLIDEYPIDFIGHLNRGILADAAEVARYAHQKGVYIELNGRHRSLRPAEIKQMVADGVEFICNSDAHTPDDVGVMKEGLAVIEECGIPHELIANMDKLPSFRSPNFTSARRKKATGGEGEDGK